MEIYPYLLPYTILESKCIIDLNIKPVSLNLIEEKIGNTFEHTVLGDHFLNVIIVAQTLAAAINKRDLLKLRSFCKAKDIINKTKWQPTDLEAVFYRRTSSVCCKQT